MSALHHTLAYCGTKLITSAKVYCTGLGEEIKKHKLNKFYRVFIEIFSCTF